jgi:methylenetetrahydrofolate dehydrogenase (NADP+)/methenyltetrahydrofolate cyclohydrolase
VVLVGEDPASQIYVRRKGIVAGRLGISHQQINLPVDASQTELIGVIDRLNGDPAVDGILVQLPLPKHLDTDAVMDRIDPSKDADGLHPTNTGLLIQGRANLIACTPHGCMHLLRAGEVQLSGADAVVIGRSNIVGRPMAALLEQANCTVTLCHSRTRDLASIVRRSDVVVAAVGRPNLVRADWVKPGAAIIDVGMNRLPDGTLAGDVAYDEVAAVAGAITPVPGGVGPMTIAMLMENTVRAAEARLA